MSRKNPHRAKRMQVIALHRRLEGVIKKLPDDLCEYTEDHSDKSIADELGVAVSTVQNLRTEAFGKLYARTKEDAFKEEIATITARLDELTSKYNKLVALLMLNRTVDCKHLAIAIFQKEKDGAKPNGIVQIGGTR